MKRQRALEAEYEAQWDNGKGSHHPDYDPTVTGDDVVKASRETEELLNAIIKNDIKLVYKKIEEGADVNFVFGRAYKCEQGYTPSCAQLTEDALSARRLCSEAARTQTT